MTRKVEIGAPSLTGKDANELVAKEFTKAKYPLKLTATNLMPRDVAFPEVEGLFLRHAGNETERAKEITLENEGQLQRLTSSVSQIAELNGYERAFALEDVAAAPVAQSKGGKQAQDA